ncbi:MAG: ATP-binding protein [Melioribacteraceae bacterium]|nr:ATP-binding protein [Melioribacteraceae bacterium]
MKINKALFLLPFLNLVILCFANPSRNKLIIDEKFISNIAEIEVKLDKLIGVIEDKDGSLDIDKATSPEMQDNYRYSNIYSPNFGFSNSTFWLKIQIVDSSGSKNNLLLINNYNSLEFVSLYYKNEHGEFVESESGAAVNVAMKNIKTIGYVSNLNLRKNEDAVFYLKVKTASPVILSFSLWSHEGYINERTALLFFDGLLFGILCLMICYNTFLYISIKQTRYLFYVLYVTAYTVFLFVDKGYYSAFIGMLFQRDYYIIPGEALTFLGLFWLLLTRDYLETKTYFPVAYKILNILAVYTCVTIMISLFLPINILVAVFTINDLSFFVLGIIISVVTLKRGHKLSKFYILALSGTVIGLFIIAAKNSNILPLNFWTENALQLGILWETVILSYSLGYRMSDLEKRVQERTFELSNRTEELRNLSEHLQNVREQERKYLATEIHDEFGGMLSALKIDVLSLQDNSQSNSKNKNEKISSMIKFIDSSIKKVQKFSAELRPEILDDLGLSDAIDWYGEDFEKRSGIKCNFHRNEDDELFINTELALTLFRIFQETLTNVLRHSKANEVNISLIVNNDEIILTIKDNGIGISQEKIDDPKSIGLIGMRERINKWNGSIKISGSFNLGTEVKIRVGYDKSNNS